MLYLIIFTKGNPSIDNTKTRQISVNFIQYKGAVILELGTDVEHFLEGCPIFA